MSPEAGSESPYNLALKASPIAKAFLQNGPGSEVFEEAMQERTADLYIRHPWYDKRLIRPLTNMAETLGVLCFDESKGVEYEDYKERAAKIIEQLFAMGYELGSIENIDIVLDDIQEAVWKLNFFDDEGEEGWKQYIEDFMCSVLDAGCEYRYLDEMKVLDDLAPPVIGARRPTPRRVRNLLRGVEINLD